MPAKKNEIDKIIRESSKRLLEVAPAPVRYWLMWDVLRVDEDDPRLQTVIQECRTYPPRLRLLESLREDGTWPISRTRKMAEDSGPGPPYGWTYITILRNLDALGDYLTTMDEGRVGLSIERTLGWQTGDGYIPGPWGTFPLPHYNGYALRNLVVLGAGDDARTRKLRAWLLKKQRKDGGWVIPYLQDVKYLPRYKHMKMKDFLNLVNKGKVPYESNVLLDDVPSCLWTTMMVVRGFVAGPRPIEDKRVFRAAEFFLERFFKCNYHATFFKDQGHWTRLKYPTYFGSGLCALDLLTFMGFGPDDERMEKPIQWLMEARSNDGFWSQSDRPHREKDLWITEVALSVLARYSRMY